MRTGGHGVAYCLEMIAVISGVRAQCVVFTISRITLCRSVTVNGSDLWVARCVPSALSVVMSEFDVRETVHRQNDDVSNRQDATIFIY